MEAAEVVMPPFKNFRVGVVRSSKDDQKTGIETETSLMCYTLADDEVLVEIFLRPIHPADLASLSLSYPGYKPSEDISVPGLEGVGFVVKCGMATTLCVGDRVIGAPWQTNTGQGSWQQYAVIKEKDAKKVPPDIPDEVAAQLWLNPATALAFFDMLNIPEGEFLIQNAANSTLGKQVIALARHKRVKTINIVRRADAKEELLQLGGDVVVDIMNEDAVDVVSRVTSSHGAYAAIDAVGGTSTGLLATCVRDRGEVITYGTLAATHCTASLNDIMFRDVRINGFWLHFWLLDNAERRDAIFGEIVNLFRHKVFTLEPGLAYNIHDVHEAIKAAQQSNRNRKIFLRG